MTRLFGTDGIRGVANVDLRPSLAFALGRATAHQVVGAGGSLVVGQDTRRSGDMFVAAITAGATSMGADVHSVGVVPTPALAFLAGGRRVRGRDHGLGVAQPGRGQRPQGARPARPEARRRRRGRARGADPAGGRAAGRAAGRRSGGRSTRGALLDALRRPPARRSRRPSTRGGLHVVLDAANGAGVPGRRPRSSRATGARVTRHPRRARRRQHQPRLRRDGTRPRSPAAVASAAPTSGSRSTATPTGASRSTATGGVVDGDQVLGILALERLARGALDRRQPRRVGAVQRRAPARRSRRPAAGSSGRPVGDKHILAAMLVSGAGLGGEKSGHVIIREHTHVGRRDRHRARAAAGHDRAPGRASTSSPSAIPLLPQQQRAIRVRHRDQWENDDRCWRAIADAERAARAATGGSSSVRRAPSPSCGSWSRVRDAASWPSWPTRSRRSRGSDYTSQPGGPRREPKEIPRRMCGIVGYTGPREAGPILIEGLRRLEYRGYDSAGIALVDEQGDLFVEKKAGKLANLQTAIADRTPHAAIGLAHTRWATHGRPERPQRPPPPGLHGRHHGHPQRDHRELPGAARRARGAGPRARPPRPTPRRSPTSSRRPTRATSPTRSARRCASSRAPTRSS